MHIDGACHCGKISFTAEVDPTQVLLCHCIDCQVLSGSPFRAVAEAPIDTLKIRGAPKNYVFTQHSRHMVLFFCPDCATPLYAKDQGNPNAVVIRLGCVAQRAQLKPSVQIWESFALPWLADLASVPTLSVPEGTLPAPFQ